MPLKEPVSGVLGLAPFEEIHNLQFCPRAPPGGIRSVKTISGLREVERLADAAEDRESKVDALAGASETWARLGDEKNAFRLIDVGFDFAESVLQRDHEKSSYGVIQSPVAYLFVRLAWAEARISPQRAAVRAHAISDPRIRALVLLNVAKTVPFTETEKQL